MILLVANMLKINGTEIAEFKIFIRCFLYIFLLIIQVVVCMLWINGIHVFPQFLYFFYVCLILLIYIYSSVWLL